MRIYQFIRIFWMRRRHAYYLCMGLVVGVQALYGKGVVTGDAHIANLTDGDRSNCLTLDMLINMINVTKTCDENR